MEHVNIKDLNFEPTHSEVDFNNAETFLNRKGFLGTTNFAKFGQSMVDENLGQACHYSMSYKVRSFVPTLIATEVLYDITDRNETGRPYARDDNYNRKYYDRNTRVVDGFYNWFVNNSIFGRFILNRGMESAKRGWIVSTSVPSPIMQTIMIVSRHFYECIPQAYEKFDKLVVDGILPEVAYVAAFNSFWSDNCPSYLQNNNIYTPLDAHRAFPFPSDINILRNFINGLVDPILISKSYRENPSILGTTTLFGKSSGGRPFTYQMMAVDRELAAFVSDLRKSAIEINPVLNPFKKTAFLDKSNPLNVTYEEMFKIIKFLSDRGDFNAKPE